MALTVEIEGTGRNSKYLVEMPNGIDEIQDQERNDNIRDGSTSAAGEVVFGTDIIVGTAPATVKNLDNTWFGSPPDIIVRGNGREITLAGNETVEFVDDLDDPGGVPEPKEFCASATVTEDTNGGGNGGGDNGGGDEEPKEDGGSRRRNIMIAGGAIGLAYLINKDDSNGGK